MDVKWYYWMISGLKKQFRNSTNKWLNDTTQEFLQEKTLWKKAKSLVVQALNGPHETKTFLYIKKHHLSSKDTDHKIGEIPAINN